MTYINNFPLQFNIPQIGFRSVSVPPKPLSGFDNDGFVSNPLTDRFGTKEEIEAAAKSNPRIRAILEENNLPLKVNEKALQDLKTGHLQKTRLIAAKMYSALPDDLKQQVDLKDLQEAAMFHDYGKVLIPDKILNKNGKLTDDEWKIMQQHSELGAELMKGKGLSNHAVELIKYHHQLPDKSGYPDVSGYYEYDINSQMLAVADKYSALTEVRSYKEALSKEDALKIITEDVDNGTVSVEVFEALKKSV